ncbi:precorrin-2 dehydrogenase [Syntrophus gentianae]|uniref:precorrin-2 dehydrogenase n=1 Tax=Syntrophus gentianae TaxID=43775 RepID=A0A1H8AI43_9BACT|nr:bifunctional precorrin-2 dehydrogenase/sirohydrochlorin ferrochelatase [Syntrophus gentianae]SEM70472.1 precorrin-2 dehydrogenase [Syntrophus gentianae]
MKYYPVFFDLREKVCLVVGGGTVAERKVQRLLECEASVRVVGESLSEGLQSLQKSGQIQCLAGRYSAACLDGAFMVICATDDRAVNEQVMRDCRSRGIPVNVVDDPERCDFILPAIAEQGDLSIAVSTGGKSPALAKRLRRELEDQYGPEYRELVNILGELRKRRLAKGYPSEENRTIFEAVVSSDILEQLRKGDREGVREKIRRLSGEDLEQNEP